MTDERDEPNVSIEADGRRRVSWQVRSADGIIEIVHHYPDALQHHYAPAGVNQDVWLYDGPFTLSDSDPYVGDVRWRWGPSPRIEVRGTRPTTESDMARFFQGPTSGGWVQTPTLDIALTDGTLPPQPVVVRSEIPNEGHFFTNHIEQELGNPTHLERVTFFVANGWPDYHAHRICDPVDPTRFWNGRTEAAGDGWRITLDMCPEMDREAWRELQDLAGYRFTHVGQLVRDDESAFTAEQAFDALDRVRLGLSMALGRRSVCSLPVGWRHDQPIWGRWRSASVDPYRSIDSSRWLDETIANKQMRAVLSKTLDFTSDNANRQALRSGVAYYMAANVDVSVELSVSIPVSGLQLLAYYRFVTQRQKYSRSTWDDMRTEDQIRLLLDDLEIDTSVRPHFENLSNLSTRLPRTDAGHLRDALGSIVKMRNVVTHPTRDMPNTFTYYEWAEAGMQVRYWICLALLNTVGYEGEIADVLQHESRWPGELRPAPWSTAQDQR